MDCIRQREGIEKRFGVSHRAVTLYRIDVTIVLPATSLFISTRLMATP
jgi:hypothetical protein